MSSRRKPPEGPETPSPFVTFKDLYEVMDKVNTRTRRIEIGGVLLTAAVASPKLGAPSPQQIVASIISFFA